MRISAFVRVLGGLLVILLAAGCTATQAANPAPPQSFYGPGMMGAGVSGPWASAWQPGQLQPGSPGFTAGTAKAPRIVQVLSGPGLTFTPDDIPIEAGETITFEVTTVGPTIHEFKVGPLAEVIADSDAAPEIADIGMMATRSLTYTFSGPGPYGFACHEPGHFEGGMRGTVTIVG
jgi:uncharacterized cupredoxin-like copper-binding protein